MDARLLPWFSAEGIKPALLMKRTHMSAEEKLAADPQIRLDQAALNPMIAATAHRGPADAGELLTRPLGFLSVTIG
jgi:hypothetical protein